MSGKHWLLDVIEDLQKFAEDSDMEASASILAETKKIAEKELRVHETPQVSKGPIAVTKDFAWPVNQD